MRLQRLTEPDAFDAYVAKVKADADARFEARRAENVARLEASKAERDAYRERAGTPLTSNGQLRKPVAPPAPAPARKDVMPRGNAEHTPAHWQLTRNEELMFAAIAARAHGSLDDLAEHFSSRRGVYANRLATRVVLASVRRKLARHGIRVARFGRKGGDLPMLPLMPSLRQRLATLIDGARS